MKLNIYTISLYLFLVSIALFRLPYVYLFPGISSAFLTTQAVARVLLVLSLCIGLVFTKKKIQFNKDGVIINILLLAFLGISSLSILSAQNIDAFIGRYKDFVIGILAFYTFYLFRKEEKKIAFSLLITMPVMILYQLILLYGGSLNDFLIPLIYQRHFDILSYNLDRGRIYVDSYDEAFIPLIVTVTAFRSKGKTLLSLLLVSLLSFLAFIANFRTRIGMLFIGLLGSFVVANRKVTHRTFGIFLVLAICGIVTGIIAAYVSGAVFYERFILTDEENIVTIDSRYDQVNMALLMGFASPFGVGLGNYYDNLPNNKFKSLSPPPAANISAREYIHNNVATIIAESGYIAFGLFVLLLLKFMQSDFKTMQEKNNYKRAFVFAFWSLFFYGFFNPPIPISYQVLFWGMRGLLV